MREIRRENGCKVGESKNELEPMRIDWLRVRFLFLILVVSILKYPGPCPRAKQTHLAQEPEKPEEDLAEITGIAVLVTTSQQPGELTDKWQWVWATKRLQPPLHFASLPLEPVGDHSNQKHTGEGVLGSVVHPRQVVALQSLHSCYSNNSSEKAWSSSKF